MSFSFDENFLKQFSDGDSLIMNVNAENTENFKYINFIFLVPWIVALRMESVMFSRRGLESLTSRVWIFTKYELKHCSDMREVN